MKFRFFIYWFPFLIYSAVILAVSSIPHLSTGRIPDKFPHFTEYAIYGFLLFRALTAGQLDHFSWKLAAVSLMVGALFACFDEFYQSFIPGRDSSIKDWYADVAGIFAMITFVLMRFNFKHRATQTP